MPDSVGVNGLQVQTSAELISDLINGFLDPTSGNYIPGFDAIYGADVNVDSNSPDGQMIGLFAQMNVDLRELLVQVNNSFDPDQAQGILLDQRVAINNITRIGGTYTIQPIDITVSTTVTLQGLDSNFSNPNGTGYTVQDDSGNQFILGATVTITAGLNTLDFRAQQIGAVSVPVDTITNPVTIVPGVTSINNSSSAITVGVNEETDAQLRIRRASSVANATTGYLNGLLGVVETLPGVTEAVLYENDTGSTDANGIPAHSIWLIVAGGSSADIANAIYNRKSFGCGMKGSISVPIVTASGAIFNALYDVPTAENLYIKFTIQTTVPGFIFSLSAIEDAMVANLIYGIGQAAETSALTAAAVAAIQSQGGGGVPLLMQVSNDNATWTDYLAPTGINYQWTLDPAHFTITVLT